MPASPFRSSEWNSQQEFCAPPWNRLYFYASVVQLKNAIGHRQANTAASGFGSEVEVKDFFANVVGDSGALVGDAEEGEFAFFFKDDAEGTAFGHGLGAVLDDVEGGLLDEVGVNVDEHGAVGQLVDEGDVVGGEFGGGEGEDAADDGAEVLFAELEFNGSAEIDEELDNAVEAMDFGFDDFEVTHGRSAGTGELAFEELDMDDDGVDGVFDFVPDAGGESADGGHAAGELEFRLDGFGGLKVMKGNERAEALAGVVVEDEVDGGLDAATGFGEDFFLNEGDAGVKRVAEDDAEDGGAIEDFASVEAEDCVSLDGEESAGGFRDKDSAAVSGEEQDAVLKISENLIEVLFQGGEDFFDIAHALTEALDFSGDGGCGVLARGFASRGG